MAIQEETEDDTDTAEQYLPGKVSAGYTGVIYTLKPSEHDFDKLVKAVGFIGFDQRVEAIKHKVVGTEVPVGLFRVRKYTKFATVAERISRTGLQFCNTMQVMQLRRQLAKAEDKEPDAPRLDWTRWIVAGADMVFDDDEADPDYPTTKGASMTLVPYTVYIGGMHLALRNIELDFVPGTNFLVRPKK